MFLMRVLCLLLLLCPLAAAAQLDGLVNYTQEQGLNAVFTYRLTQDEDGFIWVGSDNGLYRFDGVEFKHYDRSDGLLNMDIIQAVPLAGKELFVEAFRNDFFVIRKGRVQTARDISGLGGIPVPNAGTHHLSILGDGHTALFVDKLAPVETITYGHGKVTRRPLHFPPGFPASEYTSMSFPKSDTILLTKDRKVWLANYRTGGVRYKGEWPMLITSGGGINKTRMVTFRDGELWLLDRRFPNFFESHSFAGTVSVAYQAGPYLWAALSTGGVAIFDLDRDPHLRSPFFLLGDYMIQDILRDADQNFWFSTRNKGILFLSKQSFRRFLLDPKGLNRAGITALSHTHDDLLFGFNEGSIGRSHGGRTVPVKIDNNRFEVRSISGDERYIITGRSQGLFRFDGRTGISREITIENHRQVAVKNIIPYAKGKVLVCCGMRCILYDYVNDRIERIIRQNAYCAAFLSDNRMLVGDFRNIYEYDLRTLKRKLFLDGYYVSDIERIDDNHFVAATNGYGVLFFDDKGKVSKVTTRNGLPTDQISRVRMERKGVYWACTASGLCRIEITPGGVVSKTFDRNDGLPSDRISDCVVRRDTLFAGTAAGLAILPIEKLLKQSVYFNKKVIVNSVSAGETTWEMPSGVTTEYPSNTIVVNLSFLDYLSKGKIGYKYRIDGLDAKWQETTSPRIILTALPPGSYRLVIYGLGYNGKRSREATIIPIHVRPRFWQTWWFQLLASGAVFGLAFVLLLYLLRRRRDKRLRELLYSQKVAELELQAVKAQMNPHFVYNCLNSIQYLLLKEDYRGTEKYLGAFSRLIRSTLHYSEYTFLPVREEIAYLELYLAMEKLRFRERFSYRILCGEGVNPETMVPSLLVQPFVENALKHGVGALPEDVPGRLDIIFDTGASDLRIIVRDNGPGLSGDDMAKPSSFGLRIAGKRMETYEQLFSTKIRMEVIDLREEGKTGLEIHLFIATT